MTIDKYIRSANAEYSRITALNVAVLTAPGRFRLISVTPEDARKIWKETPIRESAIGHEATAKVMSTLLDDDIPVNRVKFVQEAGEIVMVLQMRERIPEGTVLTTVEEMDAIGYDFFLLYMGKADGQAGWLERHC